LGIFDFGFSIDDWTPPGGAGVIEIENRQTKIKKRPPRRELAHLSMVGGSGSVVARASRSR
jgi:hypothetical protein